MKRIKYPKAKRQIKKERPWLILWNDARLLNSKSWWGAEDRKHVRQTAEEVFQTVAWCIDRTKNNLILAAERYPQGDGWNYGSIITIPKGCILSMRRMK